MKVLIISPHSKCDDKNKQRHCDRRAKEMAERLYKLSKNTYDTTLMLANNLREDIDYNRISAVDSEWRKKIRTFIENNINEKILVLEIHSFPDNHHEIRGKTALVSNKLNAPEMIMFSKLLKKNNFNIDMMIVTGITDIMNDLNQYNNVVHHLLEFNENTEQYHYTDSDINSMMTAGVATVFMKKPNYLLGLIICVLLIYIIYWGSAILKLNGLFHALCLNPTRVQFGERLKNL